MRIAKPPKAPTTKTRIKRRPGLNSGQDKASSQPKNAPTMSRNTAPSHAHASLRIKPKSNAEPRPTMSSQRGAVVTRARTGKLLRSNAARRGLDEYLGVLGTRGAAVDYCQIEIAGHLGHGRRRYLLVPSYSWPRLSLSTDFGPEIKSERPTNSSAR